MTSRLGAGSVSQLQRPPPGQGAARSSMMDNRLPQSPSRQQLPMSGAVRGQFFTQYVMCIYFW